jgi:hypothetical protein
MTRTQKSSLYMTSSKSGVEKSKVRKPCRGILVPTSLFVAMFVLLMVTVLVSSVSYDLGSSMRSLEIVELRYRSLGATNLLLSDLNDGLPRNRYTEDDPFRDPNQSGGYITESWVEPIEDSDKNVFIVGKSYREGRGQPAIVKRLSTYREHTRTRVYTNVTDVDPNSPDPIYYNDVNDFSSSDSWNSLPAPPRLRYKANGELDESRRDEEAGSTPYITGSPDGSLYALYLPTFDGWDAQPDILMGIIPFPSTIPLATIVDSNKRGMTLADIMGNPQMLVENVSHVNISKGGLYLKYSHDTNEWAPLPPAPEAPLVGDEFVATEGDYHIQGVAGSPIGSDKGLSIPLIRKGEDSVYLYSDQTESWSVVNPPGRDILLQAGDQEGAVYVQMGEVQAAAPEFMESTILGMLAGEIPNLQPDSPISNLHMYVDDEWRDIPDPPAKFYDKDSGQLVSSSYSGSRGPVLGAMVGGKKGELIVVNRPSNSQLVDTIYKYSEGVWEVMPSPPNKSFDSSGAEIEKSGLPSRLEACVGADGQLIVRIPSASGLDGIFLQDERDKAKYDLLPPIEAPEGGYEQYLSQMAVGKRRSEDGLGAFFVKATYF